MPHGWATPDEEAARQTYLSDGRQKYELAFQKPLTGGTNELVHCGITLLRKIGDTSLARLELQLSAIIPDF